MQQQQQQQQMCFPSDGGHGRVPQFSDIKLEDLDSFLLPAVSTASEPELPKPNENFWMIMGTFESIQSSVFQEHHRLLDKISNCHRGVCAMDRADFHELTKMTQKIFHYFGESQPRFMAMHPRDRQLLLAYNRRLYLNFIFGRYFASMTGGEQLRWMFNDAAGTIKDQFGVEKDPFFISFQSLAESAGLWDFSTGTQIQSYYLEMSYSLKKLRILPKLKSIMALSLLYHMPPNMALVDPTLVHLNSAHILNLLEKTLSEYVTQADLKKSMQTLLNMSTLFDQGFSFCQTETTGKLGQHTYVVSKIHKHWLFYQYVQIIIIIVYGLIKKMSLFF